MMGKKRYQGIDGEWLTDGQWKGKGHFPRHVTDRDEEKKREKRLVWLRNEVLRRQH